MKEYLEIQILSKKEVCLEDIRVVYGVGNRASQIGISRAARYYAVTFLPRHAWQRS
jgi:hypothetical protein